ncbi:MAG: AMP-binding protein, partial [Candidatus Eremiobacteraeota bacterium]|nr:AMP-binding protein [Candidatus Eremiobacteraeota bacterium]
MMSFSLAALLAESALRYPDRAAFKLGPDEVVYRDLWEQARRYATVFAAHGVKAGDTVALMMPNVFDYPRAYYGILCLGAIVVPVHSLLLADEVAYVLQDSGAALLVVADVFTEGSQGAVKLGIPALRTSTLATMAAQADPVESYLERDPQDDAVILYTSGTTGRPKGAVLSNYNISMNVQIIVSDLFAIQPDDRLLGCLPLFHSFGQTTVMNAAIRAGACVILMPRFEGATALDLLVTEQITLFMGVPTMYHALLEAAKNDTRRPNALRTAVSGGSSLPRVTLEAFEATFATPIYEGYGLSETSPVASFNQDIFGRKPGTVGCGIWGVDLRIARAEIEDRLEFLPYGEIGEVVIRGHCVFKGYLNRPEATAAAVIDGWFRSGDLGTQDATGFVTIVDRKKDMVLRGGYNVYPREVEEVLMRHPAVSQVAVIGLPDAVHGEEVCAIVVR